MTVEPDYCGCCGNENDGGYDFCERCMDHVGRFSGAPWMRTYFALHGVDCPFQVERVIL